MGNKLCKKKKTDVVDGTDANTATKLDRIISRLQLLPNSWKSDPNLNQKQVNRCEVYPNSSNDKENILVYSQPLSKSLDWTQVDLEVPNKEDHVHLRNPKLSKIFNNELTPTPPPRKHKKNFREKIEAVAKNGLQAFQNKNQTPVKEPVFIQKKINYSCPLCNKDEKRHNRDHHHHHGTSNKNNDTESKKNNQINSEEIKRKKNLSVVSLPNYSDLKLTVVNFRENITTETCDSSNNSLPGDKKSQIGSTGKLDNYITRCRSFGSLLPQQLKKLKIKKASADIESDDSFGGLEDWDLGLIEHYNPKDASLPRPRKVIQKNQRHSKEVLSDIENLIVKEEDIEKVKPKFPYRKPEYIMKKINGEATETAYKRPNDLLPAQKHTNSDRGQSTTPPYSPISIKSELKLFQPNLFTKEDSKVEHSSLMKILEQYSIKDTLLNGPRDQNEVNKTTEQTDVKTDSNEFFTPSLFEFKRNIACNTMEDIINAEKLNADVSFSKQNNVS